MKRAGMAWEVQGFLDQRLGPGCCWSPSFRCAICGAMYSLEGVLPGKNDTKLESPGALYKFTHWAHGEWEKSCSHELNQMPSQCWAIVSMWQRTVLIELERLIPSQRVWCLHMHCPGPFMIKGLFFQARTSQPCPAFDLLFFEKMTVCLFGFACMITWSLLVGVLQCIVAVKTFMALEVQAWKEIPSPQKMHSIQIVISTFWWPYLSPVVKKRPS